MQAKGSELDMLVLSFTCRDSSKFGSVGKQSKELVWKVAAMGTPPVEINVSLEKQPMFSPEVSISADGARLFPVAGGEKSKMKEDFAQKWSFRGQAQNLDLKGFWEVKPKAMGDNWFPASGLEQRKDGLFEASVWLPDGAGGAKEIVMPAVDRCDIREVKTKALLEVPVRSVFLRVPAADPMSDIAFSLMDGLEEEPLTFSMARVTPPPGPSSMPSQPGDTGIVMELSKDRKALSTNTSIEALGSFLTSDVRALTFLPEGKTKCTWKLMLGPFAEHTITIEKKASGASAGVLSGGLLKGAVGDLATKELLKKSEVVCLTVDGQVLVEGTSEDFDADWESPQHPNLASESDWVCRFRFAGERSLKCKVFETNADNITLDTTALVECLREDQKPISKVVTVAIKELQDLSTAYLDIDGVAFGMLKEFEKPGGTPLQGGPEALMMNFGIQVPNKVRDIAPLAIIQEKLQMGGAALASNLKEHWEKHQPVLKEQWQGALGKMQEGMGKWFKKE